MKEIEIIFEKTGYLAPRDPVVVKLPTKWSEVTEDQFILMVDEAMSGDTTAKKMLNIITNLNIGIHEDISDGSLAAVIHCLDKIRQPDNYSNFIVKEYCGQKVCDPYIMNHTIEALAHGVLYYKQFKKVDGKVPVNFLLRLFACFYHNAERFRKENIDYFIKSFDLETDTKLLPSISFNFGLIYNWLKETYPYAFRLADPDVQTSNKYDWFQVAYFLSPAFYSQFPLVDSLKKIDLSIKDYIENGIQSAKMTENLLYPSKN